MRHCNSREADIEYDKPHFICALLYLLHCGRSAQPTVLLDLPVIPYSRHPLSISVGKADHSQSMACGLTYDQKISLDNFRSDLCNLCIEPWGPNAAKLNHDELADAMRNDFRANLKAHNPPYWTDLKRKNPMVTSQYIKNAKAMLCVASNTTIGSKVPPTPAGPVDIPVVVPECRNLFNIGQTCYMSTVLQILHNNSRVRQFIAGVHNFGFREHTGTDDTTFLPSGLTFADVGDDAAIVQAYRLARLAGQLSFVNNMRQLNAKLDQGGDQLPASDTKSILVSHCRCWYDATLLTQSSESCLYSRQQME